jgi:hypothetical protein
MFAVNLYLIDRAFGGREEGGWWYDCGQPVLHPLNRVFETLEEAQHHQHFCLDVQDQLNEGLPSINSVLSQGQYRFYVGDEGELPAPFPAVKPHYE